MNKLLFVLLAVLGYFQYRWIDQISHSERIRLGSLFHLSGQQMANHIRREFFELGHSFWFSGRPDVFRQRSHDSNNSPQAINNADEGIANGLKRWQDEALFPDLLEGIWVITGEQDDRKAQKWNSDDNQLEQVDWPDFLPRAQDWPGLEGSRMRAPLQFIKWIPPHIVLPIVGWNDSLNQEGQATTPRSGRGRGQSDHGGPPMSAPRIEGYLVLKIDTNVLINSLMPYVVKEVAGNPAKHMIRVQLVDGEGKSLFDSAPDSKDKIAAPLYSEPIVSRFRGPVEQDRGQVWKLELIHPGGDLEAVVRHFRYRNLFLAFIIIFLLAAAMGYVMKNNRKSQELAKRQLSFVAGVSHELLTPLAGLQSAGENLAQGLVKTPEKMTSYGKMIQREARRLGAMVTQILDYSKTQTLQGNFSRQDCFIGELLNQALEENVLNLEQTGLKVRLSETPASANVLVDRKSIVRVFNNIIENACKYASKGEFLDIETRLENQDVHVLFRNFGPPIPKNEWKSIFEPFSRGSEMVASNVPGSGLGLHLVKRILDMHGGKVLIKSGNQETIFSVVLPRQETKEAAL